MASLDSDLGQAQQPSPANIAWLGDDLLAKCFAPLSQKDRLCNAALVCRRWHALSTRPELLRKLEFSDVLKSAAHRFKLADAQSLLRWMQLYGRGVRDLDLGLGQFRRRTDDDRIEIVSLLDSCITICAGSLERLYLSLDGQHYTLGGGWMAAANQLEEMKLSCSGASCTVPRTLEHHTSLRRLSVFTDELRMGAGVALPSSITHLSLEGLHGVKLPAPVVFALGNLRKLILTSVECSAGGMANLTRLSSLQHAIFNDCTLPDCLPNLTELEVLALNAHEVGSTEVDMDSLNAALPHLTQLTGLWISDRSVPGAVQPSVACLSRLQWLYLDRGMPTGLAPDEWADGAERPVLPLGPWQHSLRHIITSFELVQSSLPFLRGADRLQRIVFTWLPSWEPGAEEQWHAFWRWAAEHPSLECIGFPSEDTGEPLEGELLVAVQELKQRRPALCIDANVAINDIFDDLREQ